MFKFKDFLQIYKLYEDIECYSSTNKNIFKTSSTVFENILRKVYLLVINPLQFPQPYLPFKVLSNLYVAPVIYMETYVRESFKYSPKKC